MNVEYNEALCGLIRDTAAEVTAEKVLVYGYLPGVL